MSRWKPWAAAAALILVASLSAPPVGADGDERLALGSAYLSSPLGRAHRVEIVGTLGGKARVTLDPNACTVGALGDAQACTRMAVQPVEVSLLQAKLADPLGQGRRLYLLAGDLGPKGSQWFLVAPPRDGGAYRLVVDLGGGRRRVVTLEPASYEPDGGGRVPVEESELELCEATYAAERVGDEIRITATGKHPTMGYKAEFERLPIEIYPPQFRLVHRRPTGMVPQAVTPFTVTTSFELKGIVTHVTVHDALGRHRLRVENPAEK